jgi:hypothetical protein
MVVLASDGTVANPAATTFTKPVGVACFSPSNMQPAVPAAGFVYKAGDMVPCLRRGRVYMSYNGGTPATLTQANIKHSSTIATYRGQVTASATSAGAGTEISDPGPVLFVEAGPTGMWLMEVNFPGQTIEADSRLDALEADASTANASFSVALTGWLDADGDPLVKFVADNVGTVGYNLADSEALNLRWNNYPGNPGVTAICQFALPADLDDAAAVVLQFLCSKSGATVGDATKITYAAYLISEGDLHDADTVVTGDTDALVGNATAKTTDILTATIAAGDVPVGAASMTLKIFPKSGLIETDDFMVHAVRVKYTRKIQTS